MENIDTSMIIKKISQFLENDISWSRGSSMMTNDDSMYEGEIDEEKISYQYIQSDEDQIDSDIIFQEMI